MDIYQFVPIGRFTRSFRPQHRKQLLELLRWYDLLSGVVTLLIVSLVVVPLIRHLSPIYVAWPIGYSLYLIAKVALGPMTSWGMPALPALQWIANQLHTSTQHTSMLKKRLSFLREPRYQNYIIALLLIAGALAFSIVVRRADEQLGQPVEYDGALWLLFVLPILRLTRYGSVRSLAIMTGFACCSIALTHALADEPFTFTSVRLIGIQCAWLILICLLPGVLASYLTETRYGIEAASAVVRSIASLPFVSEEDFLNRAAAIMQDHLGYAEVNILLPTMDREHGYKTLRLVGGATAQARQLIKEGLAIDVSQGRGVTVQALIQRTPQVVNDVDRDARERCICWGRDLLEKTRSEMALPIQLGEKLFGVLDIHCDYTFAFSADDEAIMHAIVTHLAVALDDHYNLEQIKGFHLATQSITRYFLSHNAAQPMLDAIASAACQALAASSVVLYAWDPVREAFLEPVVAGNLAVPPASAADIADPDCDSIVRRIMQRAERQARAPKTSEETRAEMWMLDKEARGTFTERAGIKTSIAFALYAGATSGSQAHALGAVFINYDQPRSITESHRHWCQTLSTLASVALQNAWLHEQIIDEERWDLWAEIHDGMVQDAWIMRDAVATVASLCERAAPLTDAERHELGRVVWCSTSLHREVNYLDALWGHQQQRGAALGAYAADGMQCSIGLFDEMRRYALIVEQAMQVACTCTFEGDDAIVPMDVRHAIWMIVRESVRNAWRHGRAKQIHLRMEVASDIVTLAITDDGVGFWPGRVRVPRGLKSIRKRAQSCGGDADVRSTPGHGAEVWATMPLGWTSTSVERILPYIPSISVLGSAS